MAGRRHGRRDWPVRAWRVAQVERAGKAVRLRRAHCARVGACPSVSGPSQHAGACSSAVGARRHAGTRSGTKTPRDSPVQMTFSPNF
jgi:hypothetical protein